MMINPTVGPIKKQSPKKNTSKTISHNIPLLAPKSPKESKEMNGNETFWNHLPWSLQPNLIFLMANPTETAFTSKSLESKVCPNWNCVCFGWHIFYGRKKPMAVAPLPLTEWWDWWILWDLGGRLARLHRVAPGEVKPKKGKKITVLHGSAVIQMLHVENMKTLRLNTYNFPLNWFPSFCAFDPQLKLSVSEFWHLGPVQAAKICRKPIPSLKLAARPWKLMVVFIWKAYFQGLPQF